VENKIFENEKKYSVIPSNWTFSTRQVISVDGQVNKELPL